MKPANQEKSERENREEGKPKKVYETPRLTRHWTMEKLTKYTTSG